ncbi:hypothetical protein Psesu_2225 [Pseudoxanthomonas suwonensis 11-1]|uniref:Uncharacterized protein n=1 Tax=Pseudoxanthomonas suwonensis (strain 11-1) TaxID=743721 RepID=E6WV60_PSEUU|nr:DUF6065 family protein [Pseudoxanthomonas suwonensis]ADV28059.1 hypothetical protein Psesu_2225 [Pseudoxanthomonas suwonensis 11-1]
MKLTAHVLDGHTLDIRPAPLERDWMDATAQRYAYRCLPLDMANALGWELLCQSGFSASWNGGDGLDDLAIVADPGTRAPAVSHFGHGVLTFHIPCLFRTDPRVELLVGGPVNRPKDGIAGLTGLVETDWSPYAFTMNWRFTRPCTVRFEAGEPFAHLLPLQATLLDQVEACWKPLSETPELEAEYLRWTESREHFLRTLHDPASQAAREQWQRSYFRGVDTGGCPAPRHRTKLRLPMFNRGG